MSLIDQIMEHEGYRPGVYQCTEGHDTIGIGFKVSDLQLDLDIAKEILKRKLDLLIKRVITGIWSTSNILSWFILVYLQAEQVYTR
mgnify:CR=1 FL=1